MCRCARSDHEESGCAKPSPTKALQRANPPRTASYRLLCLLPRFAAAVCQQYEKPRSTSQKRHWNTGVMEYWSNVSTPVFHYSTNPLFHFYSPYSRVQLSQRIFLRLSSDTPSISKNSSTP